MTAGGDPALVVVDSVTFKLQKPGCSDDLLRAQHAQGLVPEVAFY